MIAFYLLSGAAQADPALAPGKPAGIARADLNDMVNIYTGVALVGALLFGVIATTGDPPTVQVVSTTST